MTSSFASLHFGISYKGAHHLGNQNIKSLLQRKTFLSFYLQGKLKYKIFSVNTMYYLLKDYKLAKIQHSYGIFYSLGNMIISYKNELFYKNEIYKIVTLASIVEREYQVDEEASIISGVFTNRLNIKMPLQSCATVEYIITEIEGKPHPKRLFFEDIERKNEYNILGGIQPMCLIFE